ncbi:MAG TPA: BON domain-containing protein [Blastocatellia bacterium]|nr:BON domain-containing protein [Blastocatellia bacterium]
MQSTTTVKSDTQIQQEVLEELKWDSRVKETDIGVTVRHGVVTLTGTVSSYDEKISAQEAAHRVEGVLDVANDIEVVVPALMSRTDAEIAEAVRRALEWDVTVPDERIKSTVSNGWVTLEGTVNLLRERIDAERAVRRLAGVRGVTNLIAVSPSIEPEELRRMIEEALERRAKREADRIQIELKDGVVALSGRVYTWREKRAIIGIVSHAPGVREVIDELRIVPY